MVANTAPIFPLTPHIEWNTAGLTTENLALTGAGTVNTDIWLIFTAGANGSRVDEIRIKSLGTNIQTVLRIFVNNNGGTIGTTAANALIYEFTIPATTASAISALDEIVIQPDFLVLPGGGTPYRLYATVGDTIAAGLKVTCFGGDY